MKVEILGAHNLESATTKLASLLIDDVLAIDAGSLTSSLSLEAQRNVRYILITHRHYDHIRDVATIGLNTYYADTIDLYAPASVLDILTTYLFNGKIYPDFSQRPSPQQPSIRLNPIEAHQEIAISDYTVLALPVNHTAPTVGYQITDKDKSSFFYTSDTGAGLSACWERISPKLLITELTLCNVHYEMASNAKHLTPQTLKQELLEFQKLQGYLPPVIVVHMNPEYEPQIKKEIAELANELETSISLGHAGMTIEVH